MRLAQTQFWPALRYFEAVAPLTALFAERSHRKHNSGDRLLVALRNDANYSRLPGFAACFESGSTVHYFRTGAASSVPQVRKRLEENVDGDRRHI